MAFAECVGLTCAIPFRAVGLATGLAPLLEGRKIISTRKGYLHNIVDVRFPEERWSPEAYPRMYPHIEHIGGVEFEEFIEE